ncbi:MAG: alanine--tRNA ligase [Bacteroidales bacterium]|nr:alanine--tRNA ligase [Bacteroidales bacterium]MBN2762280.1 alanine--tRNA ligase [Bacteroidales bacterium]
MDAQTIRQKFLDFFRSKGHNIIPSSPMVIKDDPSLMFTNAGMNQFKDIFLGTAPFRHKRIANSQKCLRVSGKHNDLEEVGHDCYHHTMFEMLGNWSFGDYFKKEAIGWAWELLTDEFRIPKDRIYTTVFEGSSEEGISMDGEAFDHWKQYLDEDRILTGSKKDNFWEMGDTGPCGPCSEIHVDLRPDQERNKVNGRDLVNKGHPQVIEIWNLVFIQYNRRISGELERLPKKHVDTGMGFERLCMVLQQKTSSYDTDIFQPVIRQISIMCDKKYGDNEQVDVAMRVISDHLRAIAFAVADGQLPSNTRAGYVIRRILRRAVRYYFTYLEQKQPLIFKLVPSLVASMGHAFPELQAQQQFIEKVIREEELSFLRTLESGIKRLDQIIAEAGRGKSAMINGLLAFELYDTYGFPLDLTELILKEHNLTVNRSEFDEGMKQQRQRSKTDAAVDTGDWIMVNDDAEGQQFIGYDHTSADVLITRYRKVKSKEGEFFHLVFDRTPFYAESGGQVGDTGYIVRGNDRISVINTIKEHNLTVHLTKKLPADIAAQLRAQVDVKARMDTARNHSATHLLHYALRKVLGNHVEQKGSLVHPDYLRFDFSHFQKLGEDEIRKVEILVNEMIRNNHDVHIREDSFENARKAGAMALFGEKYGDRVRMVQFGDSIELCGGTHIENTCQIGYFKIISESSIAAGIRRIEAITGSGYERFVEKQETVMKELNLLLGNPPDLIKAVSNLLDEKNQLQKKITLHNQQQINATKDTLLRQVKKVGDINLIYGETPMLDSAEAVKDTAYQLRNQVENLCLILGSLINEKPLLTIMIADNLVKEKNLNASDIVKIAAKEIQGGGGGQPFYATAGGKTPGGLSKAVEKAVETVFGKKV